MGIFVLINVAFSFFCDIFKNHPKTGQNMDETVLSSLVMVDADCNSN